MKIHRNGTICVPTSDGHVVLVDSDSLTVQSKPRKLHNMPITCVTFKDEDTLITGSSDFTYNIVPLSTFSAVTSVKNLLI